MSHSLLSRVQKRLRHKRCFAESVNQLLRARACAERFGFLHEGIEHFPLLEGKLLLNGRRFPIEVPGREDDAHEIAVIVAVAALRFEEDVVIAVGGFDAGFKVSEKLAVFLILKIGVIAVC